MCFLRGIIKSRFVGYGFGGRFLVPSARRGTVVLEFARKAGSCSKDF